MAIIVSKFSLIYKIIAVLKTQLTCLEFHLYDGKFILQSCLINICSGNIGMKFNSAFCYIENEVYFVSEINYSIIVVRAELEEN